MVGQFADIKSQKEEVKPVDDVASVDSSTDKKYRMHFKKVTVLSSLKSDSDWKALCCQNFDFIKQELESFKDPSISAAKLAAMYDFNQYH